MTVHRWRRIVSIYHVIVLSLFMSGSVSAWSYEEGTVANGGTVTGTVQFSGEAPLPMPFELRRYPARVYCGALSDGSGYRLLREVVVGAQQGLKDVIVTIEGIEKGKPFGLTETKLEANICQFIPFVSVMREHHPLTLNRRHHRLICTRAHSMRCRFTIVF